MTSSQHAFSQRKVVSQFEKWNEQPCVLIMTDLQENWTNERLDKRTESGMNPGHSFGLRGADRLSARAGATGCSRSRDTVIHSAGRYSEESS